MKENFSILLSNVKDLDVHANWSAPKIDEDMQNWTLKFCYMSKHFHYDFLLPPELKDDLLNELKIN